MRMYALIRGCFHLSPAQIDAMDDYDFWEAYYQAKYFVQLAYQVKYE